MVIKKILTTALLFLSCQQHVDARQINMAVQIAYSSKTTQSDWDDFSAYLHQKIPQHSFKVELVGSAQLKDPNVYKKYEYIIANPELYIYFQEIVGASSIATMTIGAKDGMTEKHRYGGVIFTKSSRNDINELRDIRGKSIVSPNSTGAAAYLLQLDALDEAGVKIDKKDISFLETSHNIVVKKVIDGFYDVGFVRSGVIEKMVSAGSLDLRQVKIINPTTNVELMELVSTKLIPEWPLIAMPDSDSDISEQITSAIIMAYRDIDKVKLNPNVLNWTIPQDYSYVASLLRKYRIDPFQGANYTVGEILEIYWLWFVLTALLILSILVIFIFYMKKSLEKQKKLELELLEHKEELENLVNDTKDNLELATISINNSSDSMLWTRLNSSIINANSAACEMFGFTKEHMCSMLVPDISLGIDFTAWVDIVNSLKLKTYTSLESKCEKHNGDVMYVNIAANLVMLKDSSYVFMSIRDITETKNAELEIKKLNENLYELVSQETAKRVEHEKTLLQQSKMAMMGELVSSIAHHWRQPLNSLGITIQSAHMAFSAGDVDEAYMNECQLRSMELIQKVSRTIDDFRNFFQPKNEKTNFAVQDAIRSTLDIISAQLASRNITIKFDGSEISSTYGYIGELEQTLLIIISNAEDALVANKIVDPFIEISVVKSDDGKILLGIQDNAGGVPESIINRVFEPYFTTKFKSYGAGIGLYVAKELVERQMMGKLEVYNRYGGARFVITLEPTAEK